MVVVVVVVVLDGGGGGVGGGMGGVSCGGRPCGATVVFLVRVRGSHRFHRGLYKCRRTAPVVIVVVVLRCCCCKRCR